MTSVPLYVIIVVWQDIIFISAKSSSIADAAMRISRMTTRYNSVQSTSPILRDHTVRCLLLSDYLPLCFQGVRRGLISRDRSRDLRGPSASSGRQPVRLTGYPPRGTGPPAQTTSGSRPSIQPPRGRFTGSCADIMAEVEASGEDPDAPEVLQAMFTALQAQMAQTEAPPSSIPEDAFWDPSAY